ncbi:ComEC/Rec2 family competence protein, partial [Streptomonospora algeriensis]
ACRIGQGDALVLRADGGQAVVVDTGPDPVAVARCLTELRISEIALLVITHGDTDHAGGTAGALSGRSVRAALLPPGFDHPPTVRLLRRDAVALRTGSSGQRWSLPPWTLDVVWPPPDSTGGNDGSIVLLARWDGPGAPMRVLLTGDIEEPAQRTLLRTTHAVRGVDVLKVPHHGAGSQDREFIAATRPAVTLTSVGAGNPYGHPDPATWSLLRSVAPANYRTDVHGDIAVIPGPAGPEVVCRDPGARRRPRRRGRRCRRNAGSRTRQHPCACTVLLRGPGRRSGCGSPHRGVGLHRSRSLCERAGGTADRAGVERSLRRGMLQLWPPRPRPRCPSSSATRSCSPIAPSPRSSPRRAPRNPTSTCTT